MIQPTYDTKYADRNLSVFDRNLGEPRHRWYEFKEGFSAALVDEALRDMYQLRDRPLRVLDPFSGSGTTLVASGKAGHSAVGLEVNPFLAYAARAKCVAGSWREKSFQQMMAKVTHDAKHEKRSHLEGHSTFTQRPGVDKWLFNKSVLRGFSSLDAALSRRRGRFVAPLRVSLLAGLMECCNARRDGKCLRYRREWQSNGLDSSDVRHRFLSRADQVFEDINSVELKGSQLSVLTGDARTLLRGLPDANFDLVVTSPPYLNSFDYSDVYRPELFAGKFVKTNQELMRLRLRTIRSHVQANWAPATNVVSPLLHPILDELRDGRKLWSSHLPAMVQSYFADMADVLSQLYRVVRDGGRAWIVVSTSAYAGVEVPVDLVIADCAGRAGWSLMGVHVIRPLRSAGQQWSHLKSGKAPPLRESLIVLEKR